MLMLMLSRVPAVRVMAILMIAVWLPYVKHARGEDIVAMPGFTWGEARYPSSLASKDENSDGIVEGAIQQGVDWIELGDFVRFNTFVQVSYKRDTEELDYNNETKIGPGMKLRLLLDEWGAVLDAGVRYDWQYRDKAEEKSDYGPVAFLGWSGFWRHERQPPEPGQHALPLAVVGSSWGELRYPSALDEEEEENLIVEGAVEGGVDWFRLAETAVLNTFIEVKYKADSEKLDFNNEIEIGIGPKIKLAIDDFMFIDIGGKFVYDYRFESGRTEPGFIAFVRWYASWDWRGFN